MKGITQESRDELLSWWGVSESLSELHDRINATPIIPPPPDLAAKWQDRTRGGYEWKILYADDKYMFGLADGVPATWSTHTGCDISCEESNCDLLPRSRHSELIAEARSIAALAGTSGAAAVAIDKLIAALEQEGR